MTTPLEITRRLSGPGNYRAYRLRGIAAAAAFLLCIATPLSAQGLMDRLKGAAKRVTSVSAELLLMSATSIDVEALGLATVQLGGVTFGIAGLDVKDTTAMRIRAYLYNPTETEVRLPLLSEEMFILLDSRGRRIERLAPSKVKGVARGATEIVIAPLERVEIALLFGQTTSGAGEAVLKVGTAGMIRGLPMTAGVTQTAATAIEPSSPTPSPESSPTYPASQPSSPSVPRPTDSDPPERETSTAEGPRLGSYSILSYGSTSSPPLYLGEVLLERGGSYRVSRNAEEYFGGGRYSFDPATSTVRWLSGPYKENGWGGKFTISRGGRGHDLELTRNTIASNDTND